MKYAFIKANRLVFSVGMMTRVLGVSRSGFNAWHRRVRRPHHGDEREALDQAVRTVFDTHKGRYGAPRITRELSDMGVVRNRKTVDCSLRRQALRARAARKFKATTYSDHKLAVAPNLLEQNFDASAPNQKWMSDISVPQQVA